MISTPPWLDAQRRVTPRSARATQLPGISLPEGVETELLESLQRKRMHARWAKQDLQLGQVDATKDQAEAKVKAQPVIPRPSSAVLARYAPGAPCASSCAESPAVRSLREGQAGSTRVLALAKLSHRLELCLGLKEVSRRVAEPLTLPIPARNRKGFGTASEMMSSGCCFLGALIMFFFKMSHGFYSLDSFQFPTTCHCSKLSQVPPRWCG